MEMNTNGLSGVRVRSLVSNILVFEVFFKKMKVSALDRLSLPTSQEEP
jgi:hypothetical protein